MNHAQAMAPLQKEAAIHAVYQFLADQGFEDTLHQLEAESCIPYDPDELANAPSTLLSALTSYHASRSMAIARAEHGPRYQEVQAWMKSLDKKEEERVAVETGRLQTHATNIIAVKFQPNQRNASEADEGSEKELVFASGGVDKTVAVCSAQSNAVLRRIPVSGPVLSLDFNPADPRLLLATCMNGGHSVVNVEKEGEEAGLQTQVNHKKYVVCGRWSPDGRHYVTGAHDHFVHLYKQEDDADPAAASASASTPARSWSLHRRLDLGNPVESVAWIDDKHFLVSVREDNYLHQFHVDQEEAVHKWNMNESGDNHVSFTVLDMVVSPGREGHAILLATDSNRVILMQTGSNLQLRNFYNIQNDGYSTPRLAWSPCGKYGYVTSQDRTIHILDIFAGKVSGKLEGHAINVRDVSMHPTANKLVTCSFDKTCRVWSAELEATRLQREG